jgi:hypothetical protein
MSSMESAVFNGNERNIYVLSYEELSYHELHCVRLTAQQTGEDWKLREMADWAQNSYSQSEIANEDLEKFITSCRWSERRVKEGS